MTWRGRHTFVLFFKYEKETNERIRNLCCLLFGYFLFSESKNNALLEPKTGLFHRLVGLRPRLRTWALRPRSRTSKGVLEVVFEVKGVLENSTFVRLRIAIFAIRNKISAMCERVFTWWNHFGTFIFRVIFNLDLASRIVKLHCVNALTQKFWSHDVHCVRLKAT